jgi:CheY-like chemotaxis protein
LTATVDENQIHQVLLNLSTNAAQAMNDRGRLRLRLARERIDAGTARPELGLSSGHYAAISVEDDGSGISPETLPHIFEPFFTTKPVGEGTGLGLATALAIAKGHGGAIEVESSVGAGSRFTVYLPLGVQRAPEPRRATPPMMGHGQRILIVDDEEAVAVLTRTALEALGYRAECVVTPEQFLERFLQDPAGWEVLLVDQTMPRSTGLELGERVRALGHRTPIVVTSGFNRQLTPGSLQRLERARLLKKPFDLAELGRTVASALGADEDSVETPKGA